MRTLAIAGLTLLLATACAKPSSGLIKPQPPSEAAVYCAPIMEPYIVTQDDLVRAYADLLDAWTDCATRHKALVDWHGR